MTTKKGDKYRNIKIVFCAVLISVQMVSLTGCLNNLIDSNETPANASLQDKTGSNEKTMTGNSEKSDNKGQPSVSPEIVTGSTDSKSDSTEKTLKLSWAGDYYLSVINDVNVSQCYNQLKSGILNFKNNIYITQNTIHKDDLGNLISLVMCTNPEINYLDSNYNIIIDENDYVKQVKLNYSKTSEECETELSQLKIEIENICSQVEDFDDYQKIKFFHDTIIYKCSYDETADNAYSAYGCLIEGRAVCEGYSKAMQMLCERSGINCVPVLGTAVSDNGVIPHMWNKVKVNGNWYNLDITWDDPISTLGDDYIRYDYFNITDETCLSDHTFDESKYMTYPTANLTEENYFVKSGLYIENVEDGYNVFLNAVITSSQNSDKYVRVKCSSLDIYNQINTQFFGEMNGDGQLFDVLRTANEQTGGAVSASTYSLMLNENAYAITVILN